MIKRELSMEEWALKKAIDFEETVALHLKVESDARHLAIILALNIYNNKKYYLCPLTIMNYADAACYLYYRNHCSDYYQDIKDAHETFKKEQVYQKRLCI